MTDIKISQLGAAIAVNDSDLLPIVSNGSTLKAPASLVKGYAVGDTDLTGIGDGTPTGAISALNTAKQPKNLDTPLTIGGAQKTTVEAALGGLNSESQSLSTALTTQALYFTSVACSATTGNFLTKSDANITADHVVAECTFANPSAITTDVTWTTANGSVTLNGTCASATTANLVLVKKGN